MLAAGLEDEAVILAARHNTGLEHRAGVLELLGHRRAGLVTEERQRLALRCDDGDRHVVVTHVDRLPSGHERQFVRAGSGQTAPGGTTIAMR